MNRPSCLLTSVLTVGLLLLTAACSSDDGGSSSGRTDTLSPSPASASPAVRELTKDEARTALITNTDLGSQWTT
ncbi:hypothetical protein ACWF9O_41870, partial [Streptomyces sp. NPDC055085]